MEYNTIFFGDVAKIKNGYAFKSKEFQEKGIPVIKIKNIISPIVDTKDSQKVSIKTYEKTKGFSLKKNDILISLTGSGVNQMSSAVGKVGRIEFDYPALQNQRVGKFELKYSNSADLDFLFYYFLQPKITEYLVRNSTGSANQANINSKLIETVKIPNFSLIKQKSISNFLNQITRKIETNQKMIANLEKLSQILFKRWFIDFEFPNEEGIPYKSSGGEMIDSEIGEIPKGWEISKLDKIINIKSGKRPRNKVNIMDNKNKTPIIGASKIMGYTSDYLESEPILVMGRVGTHGVIQRFNNNVWPSDNTFIIKSQFMIYTYFILINIDYKSLNRGSTQPLLSQKDIKNINIIIPKSDSLIVKYEEITNIYFKEINVIKDQISYLIELRDTLLPKLMSGELEIPDDIEVNSDEFSI